MFLTRTVYLIFLTQLILVVSAHAQISGSVIQVGSGNPVHDANILVPETTVGTSTTRNGQFRLEWYNFPIRLQVSAVGFNTVYITVFESTSALQVRLEPVVYTSDQVMVASERIDINNSRTRPIPVTTIDVGEVTDRPNTAAVDLLRSQKGVYVQQTTPGQGSVYIRGRAGRDVLYLFNGLRMNPSFVRSGQNQYFGVVDPFATRQINVFRGPVSVFYGSDALSGGVNIVPIIPSLRKGDGWDGKVLMQANFEGTGEKTVHSQLGYRTESISWFISGTIRDYDYYRMSRSSSGDKWFPYSNRIENADYRYMSYLSSLRYRINDRNQISVVSFAGKIPDAPRLDQMILGYSRQVDPGIDAPDLGYASNTAPLYFSANSINLKSAVRHRVVNTANLRLGYHLLKDHRYEVPFAIPPSLAGGDTDFTLSGRTSYDKNTSRQFLSSFDVLMVPGSSTIVRVGGDMSVDFVSSSRYRIDTIQGGRTQQLSRYPDGSRYEQAGLFMHMTQNLTPNFWIEAGARYSGIQAILKLEGAESERGFDPYNTRFKYTTGSLGLTWSPIQYLYFTTNVSTGFRAPNVADLSELGERRSLFLQVPNPSLKPEHTLNMDASVRWINEVLNIEVTGYRVQYLDKIESVQTGRRIIRTAEDGRIRTLLEVMNRNESEMMLFGVESSFEFSLGESHTLGLIFNYTFGELTERNGRVSPVDRIPPANGVLYNRFTLLPALQLSASARFALAHKRLSDAESFDYRISNTGTDGFVVLQLSGSWQFNDQNTLRIFADNILDSAYREHGSTLDGLGRNLSLAYSYTF
jgi:outer membrane receptor for ferrienterochelin and colicin